MIGSLRGIVTLLGSSDVLIEINGIGYWVRATPHTLSEYRVGETAFLFTYDHVREEVHELFGFSTLEAMRFFERLLSISGVGPKVALAVLSLGSVDALKRAIMSGDLATLTSLPGVGKKIAQKIILELKGQIVDDDVTPRPDREVIDALVSLGYAEQQAREALQSINPEVTDVSERVREALRTLSS